MSSKKEYDEILYENLDKLITKSNETYAFRKLEDDKDKNYTLKIDDIKEIYNGFANESRYTDYIDNLREDLDRDIAEYVNNETREIPYRIRDRIAERDFDNLIQDIEPYNYRELLDLDALENPTIEDYINNQNVYENITQFNIFESRVIQEISSGVEKLAQLRGLEEAELRGELVLKLKTELGISAEASSILIGLQNPSIIRAVCPLLGSEAERLVKIFSDPDAVREYHEDFIKEFGLTDDYMTYRRRFAVDPKKEDVGLQEANVQLYREGLQILEGIACGEIRFDIIDDTINKLVEEKKTLGKKIGETIKAGEDASQLIKEKDRLDQKIDIYRKQEILRVLPEKVPDMEELKEALNQLAQHYLNGKMKERAEHISRSIFITDDDDIDSVEVSVWYKSLDDMPTYGEYRCCAFLDWGGGNRLFTYMEHKDVQLLDIKTDGKTAKAITVAVKDEDGKKVLLVDSVESSSHMFARKDVAEAAAKGIEDFARAAGFDAVVFSTDPGNNAPVEFVNNLDGKEEEIDLSVPAGVFLEYDGRGIRKDLGE